MDNMQPGQLIVPHGPDESNQTGDGSPDPERPVEDSEPTPHPMPEPDTTGATESAVVQPVAADTAIPAPEPQQPSSGWQFTQEATSLDDHREVSPLADVNWTAAEFIAHEKSFSWYASFIAGTVVAIALIYLLTKDKITTAIVLIVSVAFGIFAARKPGTQQYSLRNGGLQVGQKFYSLQDFKTFSVGQEGAIASVVLMPLKRFMPPLTVYVGPDIADSVVSFLGNYLPFEQHKVDAIDGLLRRIRF